LRIFDFSMSESVRCLLCIVIVIVDVFFADLSLTLMILVGLSDFSELAPTCLRQSDFEITVSEYTMHSIQLHVSMVINHAHHASLQ